MRSVSAGLRPTLRPLTVTCWMMLSGSTMKVARKATPSGATMPSASASSLRVIRDPREVGRGEALVGLAPGVVDEIGVGRRADQDRVAIGEIALEIAIADDLGRADEGEVLRPEEQDLPLAVGCGEIDRLAGGQSARPAERKA